MSDMKEKGKRFAARIGLVPDNCGVKGCPNGNAELVTLKALDPIDHTNTRIQLCAEHTVWAEQRNELAETITEALREERRRLGDKFHGEVKDVALPQGAVVDELLEGDFERDIVPLEDVIER